MLYKHDNDRASAVVWEDATEYAHDLCEHTGLHFQGDPESVPCHCGGAGERSHEERQEPRIRFVDDAHGKHGRQPRRPKGAASIRHAYA